MESGAGGGDGTLRGPGGPEPARRVAVALGFAAAVVVFAWVQARTSWYLAIDQFGYLSFARDLVAGRVDHPSAAAEILALFLPGAAADALGQTYVMRDGALYSRYAPGFPLLLALTSGLFGEPAVHEFNAFAMAALLPVIAWLSRRLLGSAWLGLGAALLVTMLPNQLLLWSISPLRDIPCHVLTLSAVALMLPRRGREELGAGRAAAAFFLLGYSVSMRVDAVLYLVPVGLLFLLRGTWRPAVLASGALAFLIGVMPLLVYNALATGNPLLPTQAMEFDSVLSRVPGAALEAGRRLAEMVLPGDAIAAVDRSGPRQFRQLVQGGGFRFAHLQSSLPGNLDLFPTVFGWLGVFLGCLGALFSVARDRAFAVATVPYVVVSTVFYSFWTRPDSRYLAGALLLFAPLVLCGARLGVEAVASTAFFRRQQALRVAFGIALLGGLGWYGVSIDFDDVSARPWCEAVLVAALVCGICLGIGGDRAAALAVRVFAILLAVGLLGVFGWRTGRSLGTQASFQAEQVAQAQENFARWVPPGSIVYTSYRYGRPAENINYYTDSHAIYLEEMLRWSLSHRTAIALGAHLGRETWLLVTPDEALRWRDNPFLRRFAELEVVRQIPPAENRSYFVASPRHRGIQLVLARMRLRKGLRNPGAVSGAGSR